MIIKLNDHHIQDWTIADVKYSKIGGIHTLSIYTWSGHMDDISFDNLTEAQVALNHIIERMNKAAVPMTKRTNNPMEEIRHD